ncbi:MAG TPA: hypothetical protein DEB24_00595 [Coriobacteriia bacterium]|nr:hypothetical protein [Coriobacteriia bacterium]
MFKYVGRALEVEYTTGYHFKIEYLTENTMRWTSLKERTDGLPMVGEETFYLHALGEEIFAINWVEDTGTVVSQTLDLAKGDVYAFMTWNDPEARGGRAVLAHNGTAKLL